MESKCLQQEPWGQLHVLQAATCNELVVELTKLAGWEAGWERQFKGLRLPAGCA